MATGPQQTEPLHEERDVVDAPANGAVIVVGCAALIGLALSGYLLYLAMSGRTAPGCGEGAGGCNVVLGSRWSQVLGVPVSAFAVGAYFVVLMSLIHARASQPQRHRDGAWRIIAFIAVAGLVTAAWFVVLQVFVLRAFCPFCMGAHLMWPVILFVSARRAAGRLKWLGVAPAGVFILAQIAVAPPPPTLDQAGDRFGNFDPAAAPTLGDPGAPHVMAFLFDYNCAFCREAHELVAQAVEHYDGQLVAIMLPTALDPACNSGAKAPGPHSATSCELARLALAVWLAQPDGFAEFDAWLIRHITESTDAPPTRTLAEARAHAENHFGTAELETALEDPRIDAMLETSGWVYGKAEFKGRRGLPRLILAGRAMPGLADRQALFDLLEQAYPGLAPAPSDEQ